MTAELKVVVDRAVGGEELLRMPDRLEPPHLAFPPSGGLVRDLKRLLRYRLCRCSTAGRISRLAAP
jgi:hypothetical protein